LGIFDPSEEQYRPFILWPAQLEKFIGRHYVFHECFPAAAQNFLEPLSDTLIELDIRYILAARHLTYTSDGSCMSLREFHYLTRLRTCQLLLFPLGNYNQPGLYKRLPLCLEELDVCLHSIPMLS
jgi:hypothetical protein